MIYWILYQENRNELEKPAITLLQVKTNFTIDKNYTFDKKLFRKSSKKTHALL